MSTPAWKPLPSARRITARTLVSRPAARNASASSNQPATGSAFTGGLSIVTVVTCARVSERIGGEARRKGAHVLLAPTVNNHRHPLAGRNFECYSEDPYLSARMAVAYIEGVQSTGVGCSVKHFVANDSEFERMTISSEVDARTLREISLVPFEAAVKEAGTWALMTAYNRVNGAYCSEHAELITMLRDEWQFDGLVMSDWYGTHSTV